MICSKRMVADLFVRKSRKMISPQTHSGGNRPLTEVNSMEVLRERIKHEGVIKIPPKFMQSLGLADGDEVNVRAEASSVVIEPVTDRRRMKLNAAIVDELVECEEMFEPELS